MKTKKILLALATILTTVSFASDTDGSTTSTIENNTIYYNSSNSGVTYGESTFTKGDSLTIGTGNNDYTEKKIIIKFPSKLDGDTGDTQSPNVIVDGSKNLGEKSIIAPIKNDGEYYVYMSSLGPKKKRVLKKSELGGIVTKDTTSIIISEQLEDTLSNSPLFFYVIPKDKFNDGDSVTFETSDLQKYLLRDKEGNVEYIVPRVNANFVKGYDNGNVAAEYLGRGNVQVMNLPRYAQYGEIKAQTETHDGAAGVEYAKDRANWFVSGATVYDYLHHKGDNVTPYLKDMDNLTLKDWKDKLGINGSAGGDATSSNNTPITFAGDTGSVNATLGSTIKVVGDKKNINVNMENDTIKVSLKDNIEVEGAKINRTILDTDDGKTAVNKEYVDKKIKSMQTQGTKRLTAGVANAIATASMPLTLQNGKHNNIGVGLGYFGGHAAVSVGYLRGFVDDNIQLKVDSSFNTLGEFSAGGGVGFSF